MEEPFRDLSYNSRFLNGQNQSSTSDLCQTARALFIFEIAKAFLSFFIFMT